MRRSPLARPHPVSNPDLVSTAPERYECLGHLVRRSACRLKKRLCAPSSSAHQCVLPTWEVRVCTGVEEGPR